MVIEDSECWTVAERCLEQPAAGVQEQTRR